MNVNIYHEFETKIFKYTINNTNTIKNITNNKIVIVLLKTPL